MKFGSKKAIFGVIWGGGFEGFGPCLGNSHPTQWHPPTFGKDLPKKSFFYTFPNSVRSFSSLYLYIADSLFFFFFFSSVFFFTPLSNATSPSVPKNGDRGAPFRFLIIFSTEKCSVRFWGGVLGGCRLPDGSGMGECTVAKLE